MTNNPLPLIPNQARQFWRASTSIYSGQQKNASPQGTDTFH